MSLKLLVNGVAIAAVALASSAGGTSAHAREWRKGHDHESQGPDSGGGRHEGREGTYVNRWGDVRHGHHADRGNGVERGRWTTRRGRDREYRPDGDHLARNLAIGTFAAVVGLALAAESERVREEYYEERD